MTKTLEDKFKEMERRPVPDEKLRDSPEDLSSHKSDKGKVVPIRVVRNEDESELEDEIPEMATLSELCHRFYVRTFTLCHEIGIEECFALCIENAHEQFPEIEIYRRGSGSLNSDYFFHDGLSIKYVYEDFSDDDSLSFLGFAIRHVLDYYLGTLHDL